MKVSKINNNYHFWGRIKIKNQFVFYELFKFSNTNYTLLVSLNDFYIEHTSYTKLCFEGNNLKYKTINSYKKLEFTSYLDLRNYIKESKKCPEIV